MSDKQEYWVRPIRDGRRWKIVIEGGVEDAESLEDKERAQVVPPFYIRSLANRFDEAHARLEAHLGHDNFRLFEFIEYIPGEVSADQSVVAGLDLLAATARARQRQVQCQVALRLVDGEQFSVRDAAEMMEISSTRVQQLLTMAREGKEPRIEVEVGYIWQNYEAYSSRLVQEMESQIRTGPDPE